MMKNKARWAIAVLKGRQLHGGRAQPRCSAPELLQPGCTSPRRPLHPGMGCGGRRKVGREGTYLESFLHSDEAKIRILAFPLHGILVTANILHRLYPLIKLQFYLFFYEIKAGFVFWRVFRFIQDPGSARPPTLPPLTRLLLLPTETVLNYPWLQHLPQWQVNSDETIKVRLTAQINLSIATPGANSICI